MNRSLIVPGIIAGIIVVIGLSGFAIWHGLGQGWFGRTHHDGSVAMQARPSQDLKNRRAAQSQAAFGAGIAEPKQIVFGDLHVHTTFSGDAYMMTLPHAAGEGLHPPADACDFARYCSRLDFFSLNDHAEGITPREWKETVESLRNCNKAAGDQNDPDLVAYLGWEWTNISFNRENHFGHKNVVMRDLDEGQIPTRPIATGGDNLEYIKQQLPPPRQLRAMAIASRGDRAYLDLAKYITDIREMPECPANVAERDLPTDCIERAATPSELFAKLDDWNFPALVIPHGLAWGIHTPPGTSWTSQLTPSNHNAKYQRLVEVYSGHGSMEQYKSFRDVRFDERGRSYCPEPEAGYEAPCWRAGNLVESRCLSQGKAADECAGQARQAREAYMNYARPSVVTKNDYGLKKTKAEAWNMVGQCKDCFLPAYDYRPLMTAQYMVAATAEAPDPQTGGPLRSRLGFMGSSDNHSARGGNGYKEYGRFMNTEARPAPHGRVAEAFHLSPDIEDERIASYHFTGGLIAVHTAARDRNSIFDGMMRKEVYGTSGPRTLLWFDVTNHPAGRLPMGSQIKISMAPQFEVRAVGSFIQKPGCPADAAQALGKERLDLLCGGECYNPSDRRHLITRIEVIRIHPQKNASEPMDGLIEDPWRIFQCPANPVGCQVTFEDPDFVTQGRDTVYYVRAIEAESDVINGQTMHCAKEGKNGVCEKLVRCSEENAGDCLSPAEERAWSSPIFVDFAG